MRNKSLYHHISWRYTSDFPNRKVPRVLLEDGKPGYVINQWIYHLIQEEISQSKLEIYLRSILHLYDFFISRKKVKTNANPDYLLRDFIDCKKYGTDCHCLRNRDTNEWQHKLGLNWKPLSTRTSTISGYLNAINTFDAWHATCHKAKRLNPYETKFLTEYERYRDYVSRTKWDMFLHLHPTKQHEKQHYAYTAHGSHIHKRFVSKRTSLPKALPFYKFIELVDRTPNPRDRMLWLLMAGGSLRRSEPLHLLYNDLSIDPNNGLPRVQLADPETGMVTYEDQREQEKITTRTEFFRNMFPKPGPFGPLQPRTLYYPKNIGLHAGFKGMTFGDSNAFCLFNNSKYIGQQYDTHSIIWADIHFQNYFRIALEEYIDHYFKRNAITGNQNPPGWPYHPWLFISIKGNYGAPLTIQGVRNAWVRAKRRIGLKEFGLHSLRHFYGYYLANVQNLTMEEAQICLHHSSINSTQIYFHFDSMIVRDSLSRKTIEQKGYDPHFYLAPSLPKPEFPKHWQVGLRKK